MLDEEIWQIEVRTPSVSWSTVDIDFERALGESVKRGDIVVAMERRLHTGLISIYHISRLLPTRLFIFSIHCRR